MIIIFKCDYCGEYVKKDHITEVSFKNPGEDQFFSSHICDKCKKKYENNEKVFKCAFCGETLNCSERVELQIRTKYNYSGFFKFICRNCANELKVDYNNPNIIVGQLVIIKNRLEEPLKSELDKIINKYIQITKYRETSPRDELKNEVKKFRQINCSNIEPSNWGNEVIRLMEKFMNYIESCL